MCTVKYGVHCVLNSSVCTEEYCVKCTLYSRGTVAKNIVSPKILNRHINPMKYIPVANVNTLSINEKNKGQFL